MSEIEIKDMLKEIRNKLDAVGLQVEWLVNRAHEVKTSEQEKINRAFDKVFGDKGGNQSVA